MKKKRKGSMSTWKDYSNIYKTNKHVLLASLPNAPFKTTYHILSTETLYNVVSKIEELDIKYSWFDFSSPVELKLIDYDTDKSYLVEVYTTTAEDKILLELALPKYIVDNV